MSEKLNVHKCEITFEPGDYAKYVAVGSKPGYKPLDLRVFEEWANATVRDAVLHVARVNYQNIDFVLERRAEFNLAPAQEEALARTSNLLKRIYNTLDSPLKRTISD